MWASLLGPLAGVVDTSLAGHYDSALLAPLAIATAIISVVLWLSNFLIHSSTVMIASQSKSELEQFKVSYKIILIITGMVALSWMILLWILRHQILQLMAIETHFMPQVLEYLEIRILGLFAPLYLMSVISVLRALEKLKISLTIILLNVCLNGLLSAFALFFLDAGLLGLAIATILAEFFSTLLSFSLSLRVQKIPFIQFFKKFNYLPRHSFFSFGKNSFYIFLRTSCLSLSLLTAVIIVNQMGEIKLAAHHLGLQFWLLVSYLTDGIAMGVTILIASKREQKNREEIKKIIRSALVLALYLGVLFSLLFYLGSNFLFYLFTQDLEIHSTLDLIWPLIIVSQIPNCLAFVWDGIHFGLSQFKALGAFMFLGVLTTILPFFSLAWSKENLIFIWGGLVCLSLFRLLTSELYARFYFRISWPAES